MSELIVGYESALDYWRAARVASSVLDPHDPNGKIYGARELPLRDQVSLALGLCNTQPPLDVIASSHASRRMHKQLSSHVWRGPLTAEHLASLGTGVYVCRMPAAFVQLGSEMDEIELAQVAYEFAGTYGITPWTQTGMTSGIRPLVDLSELWGYASAAKQMGVRGASSACRALSLVVPNSNSPRETDVAVALMRTRATGGLQMPGFAMNKAIVLSAELREFIGQARIIPDFSWPNGTLVEYDSYQEHDSPEARARDEHRRRVYRQCGMDCLTLTRGILSSDERYLAFADDLARSLGIRRRPPSDKMLQRILEFRERMFGPESIESALRKMTSV